MRLVAVPVFMAWLFGCGQRPGEGPIPGKEARGMAASEDLAPKPVGKSPDAEANLIELSEAKVGLTTKSNLGLELLVIYQVKYRFPQGQPNVASWYRCEITLDTGHVGVKMVEGKDMKSEDIIRDEVLLGMRGPDTYEIHMSEAADKGGPYRRVSNVLSDKIRKAN